MSEYMFGVICGAIGIGFPLVLTLLAVGRRLDEARAELDRFRPITKEDYLRRRGVGQ